jgi:hypothetical protein
MISENHKNDIIATGIDFMTSITRAYGTEEGMKLYENIMQNLNADIKGKIFFAMLMGDKGDTIIVKGHENCIGSKFERVKAIKDVTLWSLRQSKDYVDAIELGHPQKIPYLRAVMDRADTVLTLRKAGFVI